MACWMHAAAHQMPGFLSITTFTVPDGERVSIVGFDSEANHDTWRNHPEHQEAQRLGREQFYSEFQIRVCKVERSYGMKPKQGEHSDARSH
jgi:heme-degrading monooxygenase HmoA